MYCVLSWTACVPVPGDNPAAYGKISPELTQSLQHRWYIPLNIFFKPNYRDFRSI